MTVGINLDGRHAAGSPSAGTIIDCGFRGARLLSASTAWAYAEHVLVPDDIKIMGIITDESDGYILPQAHILQVGNEADLTSPAPDHMSSTKYVDLWALYTETYTDLNVRWYTAGFASGDPAYWDRVINGIVRRGLRRPDAVAVHPYGKSPIAASNLLDDYWNVTSEIPVAVTEWWRPASAAHIWSFQDMLNNTNDGRATVWNSWFCWSNGMVPGFGLVDTNGQPTQEGYQLVSALEGSF